MPEVSSQFSLQPKKKKENSPKKRLRTFINSKNQKTTQILLDYGLCLRL